MGEGGVVDGLHNNQPTTFATPHTLHKTQMVVSSVLLSHFLFKCTMFLSHFLVQTLNLCVASFSHFPWICQEALVVSPVCNQCNQTDFGAGVFLDTLQGTESKHLIT